MVVRPDTTIEELLQAKIISTRTYNVCRSSSAELFTVKDLLHYKKYNASFIALKNCGRKSNDELKNVISIVSTTPEYIEYFENCLTTIKQIFIDEYELYITNPSIDSKLLDYFKTLFPSVQYFLYIFFNSPESIFQSEFLDEINNDQECYNFCKDIIEVYSSAVRDLEKYFEDNNSIIVDSKICLSSIRNSFVQRYSINQLKYELSPIRISFLETEYKKLISLASARAKTLHLSNIKTIFELIPYLKYSVDDFCLHFGFKRKSSRDFYNLKNPNRNAQF